MKVYLNEKLGEISLQIDKSGTADRVLIIAHGAGAGMDHPFMEALSTEIAKSHTNCVRFNFPYIETGRKAPGSPQDAMFAWEAVIDDVKRRHPSLAVFVAGKSYGGRMASHLMAAGAMDVRGIIYFGFPLHAPGKNSKDRAHHLSSLKIPQLFLQGSRDKLANIDLMREIVADLQDGKMHEIADADHSFNVPKKTGVSKGEMISHLSQVATDWMDHIALRS